MIKLMETKRASSGSYSVVLFADTKAEVPATGTATKSLITGWCTDDDIPMGSAIYTPQMEIGQLKSNDSWEWLS